MLHLHRHHHRVLPLSQGRLHFISATRYPAASQRKNSCANLSSGARFKFQISAFMGLFDPHIRLNQGTPSNHQLDESINKCRQENKMDLHSDSFRLSGKYLRHCWRLPARYCEPRRTFSSPPSFRPPGPPGWTLSLWSPILLSLSPHPSLSTFTSFFMGQNIR